MGHHGENYDNNEQNCPQLTSWTMLDNVREVRIAKEVKRSDDWRGFDNGHVGEEYDNNEHYYLYRAIQEQHSSKDKTAHS